jgi:hypothetical protein
MRGKEKTGKINKLYGNIRKEDCLYTTDDIYLFE